jgi:hypothetical protein
VNRVVIFGGYGTFGGHISRELARRGLALTIAGRDGDRAVAFAASLGTEAGGVSADVQNSGSCRDALREATAAVHCAGPFRAADTALLDACLQVGCHYVDIADDREYAAVVRKYGERFAAKGLAAIYGCSSLPGISCALAKSMASSNPVRARVTLFIGNDNPKGRAAVASLVTGLGRPIAAPLGELRGFRDREVVPLPPPFGPRAVFNFNSPDYDLLPSMVGVRSVAVKVGFEFRLANWAFAALARLPFRYGGRTARVLDLPGRLVRGGSSGGAVMVELFEAKGSVISAAAVANRDGQRMAALPCVYAVQHLLEQITFVGADTVAELIGGDTVLKSLTDDGFEIVRSGEPRGDAAGFAEKS